MKTITINLYKFSELSEEAKKTALDQYRNKQYDNQFYFDEIINSVKKVIDLFNLKTGREYTDLRHSHIDDDILNLSGVRLYKYILNNYGKQLFTPKYIKCIDREVKWKAYKCKVNTGADGNKYTLIYSKQKTDNSCVLTGVCYDMDIFFLLSYFLLSSLYSPSFLGVITTTVTRFVGQTSVT